MGTEAHPYAEFSNMKFIDTASITIRSGNGGRGCVSFRREKFVPRGGPNGGNGGKGADVYFAATHDMTTLLDFQYKKNFEAENGQQGQGSDKDGRAGVDLVIPVPMGTVIYDEKTSSILTDLTKHGERTLLAQGGRGGRGNTFFKTSTNQTPDRAQPGEEGEFKKIRLELKLLADVGLVGLPNAGKSTFLSVISEARPKIANYPFTTLSPCLGVVKYKDAKPFVVADLPGLIEGAHEGRGMGDQFLKHCERTKIYLHLVSVSPEETVSPLERYRLIEKELVSYDPQFKKRKKMILLTKCELIPVDDVKKIVADFCRVRRGQPACRPGDIFVISSVTGFGVQDVLQKMTVVLRKT